MFENNEWNMMSVILADMEQDKWIWIIGILAVLVLAAAAGVSGNVTQMMSWMRWKDLTLNITAQNFCATEDL